ncbi:MAG: lipopolysaccharide transport periplasmic protein LptA [Marinobacter sp.]|nr:lipopolysaccharide transport periplasmic protein LptA [Marinobacter sp.]
MKPSGKQLLFWSALLAGSFLAGPAAAFDLDSDQPIKVTADSARLDDGQGIATYTGDVELVQGNAFLTADRVILHRNEQGVSNIESWGSPAHYFQPARDGEQATDAWAMEITWSADNSVVTLEKQARIEQGDNEFRGEIIHYDTARRVVTAEGGDRNTDESSGRVEMVIQPRNSSQSDNETGSDGSSQGQ